MGARNMMENHFLIFMCLNNCQELYTDGIMVIKKSVRVEKKDCGERYKGRGEKNNKIK